MKIKSPLRLAALLAGDILSLVLALWVALWLRSLAAPSQELFLTHLKPFSFIFLVWIFGFYIAGLYDRRRFLRSKLIVSLANIQAVNSLFAVAFFYLLPFYGITPKTILLIFIIVSFALLSLWRVYGQHLVGSRKAERAMIVGCGTEMEEVVAEVNGDEAYPFRFVSTIDLREGGTMLLDKIASTVREEGITYMVIDLSQGEVEPLLPRLYDTIFGSVTFVDFDELYENLFDRVPLSALKHSWFLENVSTRPRGGYDMLKRLFDIVVSLVLLIVPLVTYPFIALAVKLEDGGPVFIRQERIGQYNKTIYLWKFRSMERHEHDKWVGEGENRVTRVGALLRKTRLDEFPQLLSVLKGDLSGIGPRPDIVGLGKRLESEIPYYNVRNLVRPGLSGWAQVNQDIVPHSVEETKERLAYDLYYVKNRSLLLDIKIGLRTFKTLASRVGR